MSSHVRRLFSAGIFLLWLSAASAEEEGWRKVHVGMKTGEVVETVGEPLVTTKGRGFEVFIYDRGAEVVLFRGLVVAWTPPPGSEDDAGRQIDFSPVVEAAKEAAKEAEKQEQEAAAVRYVPRGEGRTEYERVAPSWRSRIRRF